MVLLASLHHVSALECRDALEAARANRTNRVRPWEENFDRIIIDTAPTGLELRRK